MVSVGRAAGSPRFACASSVRLMLLELDIENYAVVEKLRISFRAGLNLLTGETGSGKSIVVDAFSLLFGARSDAGAVRSGADRARVSGVFEPAADDILAATLAAAGVELEAGELIVERQILASGKSRSYVNGRPATLALLKALAPFLGDIHGQHEQQDLFSVKAQLAMLDLAAGSAETAAEVAALYREWREADARLAELRGAEQERLRLLDLYRFQTKEIESAGLDAGEEQKLDAERLKLRNLEQLNESGAVAYDALYESSGAASERLKTARQALETLARYDKERFEPLVVSIEAARASVDDAAFDLRGYLDGLEADPGRLDSLEERLASIEKLKRKYGASIADVISYGEETAEKLAEIEASEENAAALEARREDAARRYREVAEELSRRRRAGAEKLATDVETELTALAMEKARFAVSFDDGESQRFSVDGFDRIAFEVAANLGEPLRPLAQVASGGELSRITLALKTCLAPKSPRKTKKPRTLVFDEIDTGVGGRVAEALGRRLKRLSTTNQLLCVTHLPQIAGFADAHYVVGKAELDGRTFASVAELAETDRINELARMLSGSEVTKAALANAKQLIKGARAG